MTENPPEPTLAELVRTVRDLEAEDRPAELAHARAHLATALREAGNPVEALALEREALAFYLEVDAHGLAATSMFSLGLTFEDLGQPYYAIAAYRRAAERAALVDDAELVDALTARADACEEAARLATIDAELGRHAGTDV